MAKRNFIRLVKNMDDVKKGKEAQYETFFSSPGIPFRVMYEALGKMEGQNVSETESIDGMIAFVCDAYDNQFTFDDILDRVPSPELIPEMKDQIAFFARGEMEDERKKELKAMLK